MINFRPIFYINGLLLLFLSFAMLFPAAVDFIYGDEDWKVFIASAVITAFAGAFLLITNHEKERNDLALREAFLLTASCWLVVPAFASLPLIFWVGNISLVDAIFETVSGISTTGATILTNIEGLPAGIKLWRCLLQWLGGIGIVVLATAILPILKIGGMQLFRTESSDNSEKALPRAAQIASWIFSLYVGFTIICIFLLWLAGMSVFDAICHGLTTIATGGFANYNDSIGYFDNVRIEIIMIVFMLIGSLPFMLYYYIIQGRLSYLKRDTQIHWFLGLLLVAMLIMTMWLWLGDYYGSFLEALRYSSFNMVSVITTAGFASDDYNLWGGFGVVFIFLLSVMGGCTGSTTGGIKIFRYQILYYIAKSQIAQMIHPHGIFKPVYHGKTVSDVVSSSVLSFFIFFVLCFIIIAIFLAAMGLDFMTAMSGAASSLANLGPGLGEIIGPAGNYSSLPASAKLLLAFGMILGRLELFTILVLLSVRFWKA